MTTELVQRLKTAAQEEIMCREAGDTSDLWQDDASPENILIVLASLEAKDQQMAQDVQIKARLCRESNSLHDRLRDAEKRIAELEARNIPKFVRCWSCKHDIEVLAIADCDGYCPRCAAPIDLDDESCDTDGKGD